LTIACTKPATSAARLDSTASTKIGDQPSQWPAEFGNEGSFRAKRLQDAGKVLSQQWNLRVVGAN